MTAETQDLINLRLAQAEESLAEARLLVERGMRLGAMDRIYFTMFYSACALLATKEFGPAREDGVAGKFEREFVKTGLLPPEVGERFRRATQWHQSADVGAAPPPEPARLRELVADAESFVTTAKLFLARP
ncbi:HEPN domain-containing protein [bacterium]|nr:HEPN domain-containing protein [bacterium]